METLTLTLQYALAALDNQSSTQMTTAKKAVLRGIAAAKLLETILFEKEAVSTDFSSALSNDIDEIKHTGKKDFQALEKETAAMLIAMNLMDEVPDLIACDMNYETAGNSIRVYRSEETSYLSIVESVRAEILEEGPVTKECACLLWLFRETGILHDIFSIKEQSEVERRLIDLSLREAWYHPIWNAEFHNGLEESILGFLNGKRNLFKNPYLEGVNLAFPFLDRRQAIFIDCIIFNTTVKDRRQAVVDHLIEKGHHVQQIPNGTETLLKIDNVYYRLWPKVVSAAHVPIQGMQLTPVYQ